MESKYGPQQASSARPEPQGQVFVGMTNVSCLDEAGIGECMIAASVIPVRMSNYPRKTCRGTPEQGRDRRAAGYSVPQREGLRRRYRLFSYDFGPKVFVTLRRRIGADPGLSVAPLPGPDEPAFRWFLAVILPENRVGCGFLPLGLGPFWSLAGPAPFDFR